MPTDANRSNRALLVAGLGIFMVFLDTQILFVAFADIQASFPDVSTTAMSWVLSGYTLVFAALLVPAGRLADRWGRRSMFLVGLALFTVASAACGLAPTAGALIVARLVQAIGAAAITPTSLALVLRATPKERIPIAVAIWGSMGAVAAAFGPTIGGLLVDGAGWRWVFFVNVPVCVVAIVAGRRLLVESREDDPGPFPDLLGSALLALGVAAISLGLVQSDTWGWASGRTVGAIVVGLVLIALFVVRSQRQAAPALDLSLFRIPSFRWGNLATAAFGLSFTGMFLANVTYLTTVWGWDIVEAGLAMAPGPLVVLLLARRFGRLAARIGPRPLIIVGGLVYATGGVLLVTTVERDAELLDVDVPGVDADRPRRRADPAAAVERQRAGPPRRPLRARVGRQPDDATARRHVRRRAGGVLRRRRHGGRRTVALPPGVVDDHRLRRRDEHGGAGPPPAGAPARRRTRRRAGVITPA